MHLQRRTQGLLRFQNMKTHSFRSFAASDWALNQRLKNPVLKGSYKLEAEIKGNSQYLSSITVRILGDGRGRTKLTSRIFRAEIRKRKPLKTRSLLPMATSLLTVTHLKLKPVSWYGLRGRRT